MVVLVRILLDCRAALGAALERGRPLVYRVGLALQRLVEHLLGQDMADGLDGVLDGTELGAPSRTFVAIQAIDETLGDTFEIGTDRVGRGGGNRELSHPGTCWRMRRVGYLEEEYTTTARREANPTRNYFPSCPGCPSGRPSTQATPSLG